MKRLLGFAFLVAFCVSANALDFHYKCNGYINPVTHAVQTWDDNYAVCEEARKKVVFMKAKQEELASVQRELHAVFALLRAKVRFYKSQLDYAHLILNLAVQQHQAGLSPANTLANLPKVLVDYFDYLRHLTAKDRFQIINFIIQGSQIEPALTQGAAGIQSNPFYSGIYCQKVLTLSGTTYVFATYLSNGTLAYSASVNGVNRVYQSIKDDTIPKWGETRTVHEGFARGSIPHAVIGYDPNLFAKAMSHLAPTQCSVVE